MYVACFVINISMHVSALSNLERSNQHSVKYLNYLSDLCTIYLHRRYSKQILNLYLTYDIEQRDSISLTYWLL